MSTVLTLEDIAEENDIVLLDNNIYGQLNRNENGIAILDNPEYLTRVMISIRKKKNFQVTSEVYNEFARLVKKIKVIHTGQKDIRKGMREEFGEDSEEYEEAFRYTSRIKRVMKNLNKIDRNLRYRISDIERQNPEAYSSFFNIAKGVAENIHLFSFQENLAIEKQKGIQTDEKIVASAFTIASTTGKQVGVVTGDVRIHSMIKGIYNFSFSNDLFPVNASLGDSLSNFPVMPYGEIYSNPEKFAPCQISPRNINLNSIYQDYKTFPEKLKKIAGLCSLFVEEAKKLDSLVIKPYQKQISA